MNSSYDIIISIIHYVVIKTHIDFYLGILIGVSGQGSCMNHRFLVRHNTAYSSVEQSIELV